jgi:transcription antitermination factor NusG
MRSNADTMRDEFWYALYTRHQHEKTVAEFLNAKGFKVFLPLYPADHQWKDRVKRLSLPLFPCYVFIRASLDRRLAIMTTPGVHAFVGVEGRAARIPDAEIDAVHRTIDNLLRVEPHPFLRAGDWVRVKSGPLAGIEGILVRKTNQFRLVLSVEMLRKSVAVEVDPSVVEQSRPQGVGHQPLVMSTQSHLIAREGSTGRNGLNGNTDCNVRQA